MFIAAEICQYSCCAISSFSNSTFSPCYNVQLIYRIYRLRGKFFLDTNGEPPFGRNALGEIASATSYRKASAALTLLPLQDWQVQQELQQFVQQPLPYNVTTLNAQRNDTLIDVIATVTVTTANTTSYNTVTSKTKQTDLTLAAAATKLPTGGNNSRYGIGANRVGGGEDDGSKTNLAT